MNSMEENNWFGERILTRFLDYVQIDTASDKHSSSRPTTDGQWDLARKLLEELKGLGVKEASVDEHCFLVAVLDPNNPAGGSVPIGFMAHMDTTEEVSGHAVKPMVHREYNGSVIHLADGVALDPGEFPELKRYTGETIITASGDTLLGADNKAGVAEIMTAVEYLLAHPEIPHGRVEIIFTPDEETGCGMELFPLSRIQSRLCYTVDGGEEGAIEAECFEAHKAVLTFSGRSIHPGDGRGKMINAVEMAAAFVRMLPPEESPQTTDGRYGYYSPLEISGTTESAAVTVNIRDFEAEQCSRRIEAIKAMGKAVEAIYPGSSVTVNASKQYTNMKKKLDEHPEIIDFLEKAIKETGIEPKKSSIRGGTDGARLTEMGIPTPNIFTGGHNFHSRLEWAALPAMIKASQTLVNLAGLWGSNSHFPK
jgi:tripeptide aminopeptidase